MFNKDMRADYRLEDPYELVKKAGGPSTESGRWGPPSQRT